MSGWDWWFVGELVFGIAFGMTLGSWISAAIFRSLAYELLTHKSVRQLASAAEKFSGKPGGISGFLGMLFGEK